MNEDILTREDFDPLLNDTFLIKFQDGETVELKLTEVNEESNDQSERFSLIFKGDQEKTMVQQTYVLTHDKLGDVPLFLVPIAPGQYETLFNRIKE